MTLLFIDGPLQCVYFRGLVSTAAAHYGRAAVTAERVAEVGESKSQGPPRRIRVWYREQRWAGLYRRHQHSDL